MRQGRYHDGAGVAGGLVVCVESVRARPVQYEFELAGALVRDADRHLHAIDAHVARRPVRLRGDTHRVHVLRLIDPKGLIDDNGPKSVTALRDGEAATSRNGKRVARIPNIKLPKVCVPHDVRKSRPSFAAKLMARAQIAGVPSL
jgi:hypothetical protein